MTTLDTRSARAAFRQGNCRWFEVDDDTLRLLTADARVVAVIWSDGCATWWRVGEVTCAGVIDAEHTKVMVEAFLRMPL